MVHEVIRDLSIFIFAVICSFLVSYRKATKYWYVLLIIFLIGFFDNLSNTITIAFPVTQIIKSHSWNNYLYCNWSPKIYSIVFSLLLLIPLRIKNVISADDIGLRLKQNSDSIRFSILFVLFFFVTSIMIGLLGRKGPFDAKTLLFLATMPGLNEEIIYRGFMLGLFNKIFDKKFSLLGTSFGWGAILTSVVFGLLHGFNLSENYQLQFDFITIILTGIFGFFFAMIRERSGSLVFPVLAHSTTDFFHYFVRMM